MGCLAGLWLKAIEVPFVVGDRTKGTIWPRVSCDRAVRTPGKGSGGLRTRRCQKDQRMAMMQGISLMTLQKENKELRFPHSSPRGRRLGRWGRWEGCVCVCGRLHTPSPAFPEAVWVASFQRST